MKQTEINRFYNSRVWRDIKLSHLMRNPQCVCCMVKGYMKAADIVVHMIKPNGNHDLMVDKDNLHSLCNSCNNLKR